MREVEAMPSTRGGRFILLRFTTDIRFVMSYFVDGPSFAVWPPGLAFCRFASFLALPSGDEL